MKYRLSLLVMCAVLLSFSLTGCRHYASLDEITDEDLRSGGENYTASNWAGSYQDGTECHVSWGNMNGIRRVACLDSDGSSSSMLTYTVQDEGEGYRLVILFPNGALLDLEPGDQSVAFPERESHLLLAAVETGGEFTLETPADSGVTIWMPSD